MAGIRLTPDGVIQVHFVPTIADTSAPTLAEIAAGTNLTSFLTRAGIDTPDEGQEADSSDLGSERDKTVPSTISGSPQGEFWRQGDPDGGGPENDSAWTALARGTIGYIVIARFGGSGTAYAIAATDTVEVWPVRVSNRNNQRVAGGETMRFQANFSLSDDPVYAATVAAS